MAASQFKVSMLSTGGYCPRTKERFDRYGVHARGDATANTIIVNRIPKTGRFSCFQCVSMRCRHVRAVREFARTQCSFLLTEKLGQIRQCKRHGPVVQDQRHWCEWHSPKATLVRRQHEAQRAKLSWACSMAHGPVHEAEQRVLRVIRQLNDPVAIPDNVELDESLSELKHADTQYAIARQQFEFFNLGLKK